MLAPHYTDGLEIMYRDLKQVTRFVQPDPMPAEALGSTEVAKEQADANRGYHY